VHLRSASAAGVRFLAAMREWRGVKPSARAAGIGKESGFRWLRESFVALRERGVPNAEAQARLGYPSQRVLLWEEQRLARAGEEGVTT
jgi:IS30 family transposase